MRPFVLLASIVLLFLIPICAADITGAWIGEFKGPGDQTRINKFNFEVKGETLTGSVTGARDNVSKIEDGKIVGDDISFTVTRSSGNRRKWVYTGKVAGDEIILEANVDDRKFEVKLKRAK